MRVRAIDFSKLAIYGLFLNYYCYNILVGSLIPMGTYLFLGIAIVGVMITAANEPLKFDFEIKCWFWYGMVSLFTIVLAASASDAIDGLIKFFQRLVLIFLITYICEHEKSIKFAIRVLAVTAVACALSSLLTMNDFSQKLSMESGATVSTNDIGSIMAFGCFAILFAFGAGDKSKLYKTMLKIGYVIAALAVISIAGSRKSLLAVIILFGLMFIFCGRDYFKRMTATQYVCILIVGVVALYFVYTYLLPYFEDTNLYARLFGRRVEATAESDEVRVELYVVALQDFIHNILFGIGFNNYVYIHGNYTHSTYVEPLACSGIFGFLYLAPYVRVLINQWRLSFSRDERYVSENRVFQKEMFAFYIAFLFVGIGIPYLYKDIPCIILAMYVSWQKITFDELGINIYNKRGVKVNGKITNKSIANFNRL